MPPGRLSQHIFSPWGRLCDKAVVLHFDVVRAGVQLSSRDFEQASVFMQEGISNFGNCPSTLVDVDIKRFL
jgi:hypothetical protein